MKRTITLAIIAATFLVITLDASAGGRKGSHRVGGTNSHGKGSHYVGGHKR